MTSAGPRILDDDEPIPPLPLAGVEIEEAIPPPLPRGPMLLDADPDAPARVDVGWKPEVLEPPRVRAGTAFWIASGLCTLILSWLVLSAASFVLNLLQQSLGLGIMSVVALAAGGAMLGCAAVIEVRAYRSLGTVERLRAVLSAGDTTVVMARAQVRSWLGEVGAGVPDRAKVERMLEGATTVGEIRGIVRSQVADRLREAADGIGRRAALEGATLVAICPHPAWDGLIAGVRGLLVVRHVAALYGLRPGMAVTLALVRRVAWTAAGTTGLSLVSQGLADHALGSMPVLKHVVAALPGTGAVAVRLYRLAGVTAAACSPTTQ